MNDGELEGRLAGDIPVTDIDAAIAGMERPEAVMGLKLGGTKWYVRGNPDGIMLMRFIASAVSVGDMRSYAIENLVIDAQIEAWADFRADNATKYSFREWGSIADKAIQAWLGVPLEQSTSVEPS